MDAEVMVQKVACVNCGATLSVPADIERVSCAYCGSQLAIRRGDGYIASKLAEQVRTDIREVGENLSSKLDRVQDALGISTDPSAVKCEKCGRYDSVSPLAAVVQNGTTRAVIGGVEQTSQTALAAALDYRRPQFQPKKLSPRTRNLRYAGTALALFVLTGIFAGKGGIIAVIWLLGLLAVFLIAMAHRGQNEAFLARQKAEYLEAESSRRGLYDVQYYCSRCHQIFLPGSGKTFDVEDLPMILDLWTPA